MIKAEFYTNYRCCFFFNSKYFSFKIGFSDSEIANLLSYRFLAVMVLGFPLNVVKEGHKTVLLDRQFWGSYLAIGMIMAINLQVYFLLPYLFGLWGVVFTCFQVCSLPHHA